MTVQALVQDETITKLLEVIAGVRSGEIVGVTVVSTSTKGEVSMNVLSIPQRDSVRRLSA